MVNPRIQRHLEEVIAAVDGHIAQSERHISEQIERITRKVAAGEDTELSKALLQSFLSIRGSHFSHRARLIRQLLQERAALQYQLA
jgi:hypothetical protein